MSILVIVMYLILEAINYYYYSNRPLDHSNRPLDHSNRLFCTLTAC